MLVAILRMRRGQKLLVEARGCFSNRRLWNGKRTLAGEALFIEMTDHLERDPFLNVSKPGVASVT